MVCWEVGMPTALPSAQPMELSELQLEFGMGFTPPCSIPTPPQGLTWLMDHSTFMQLHRGLATHHPLPPNLGWGHNSHPEAPGSGMEGFCSVPKQEEGGEGPVGIPAHKFHP